jgi:hypothetical protein
MWTRRSTSEATSGPRRVLDIAGVMYSVAAHCTLSVTAGLPSAYS